MSGLFGGFFDVDKDGGLDAGEAIMGYAAISELEEEYGGDDYDDYDDDDDYGYDDEDGYDEDDYDDEDEFDEEYED